MMWRTRTKTLTLAVVAVLVGACNDAAPPPQLNVSVGAPFPVFTVTGLNGQPVSTVQFTGRALVLNVWATWCSPCRKELPSLQRLAEKFDPQRLSVVGVSIDGDDHLVREFLIDRKVSYANFQDAEQRVARDVLGVRAYPSTFLVSDDGVLRAVIEGAREWDSEELVRQVEGLLRDEVRRESAAQTKTAR